MTVDQITDSRLKGGTLTLATNAFAKQATTVTLEPTVNSDGDPVETLSGATISAEETYAWALNIGLIQDFTDPDGLVEFLRAHAGEEVAFAWTPNGDAGPSYAGTVKIRPTTIGGDVAVRLTSEVELPVVGDLADPTYPSA